MRVICLLAIFTMCSGGNTSFKIRSCPRVEVMKSFDMEKFSGVWYVQQRYGPVSSCIKMIIEKAEEGEYKITESGVPFGINIGLLPPLRTSRKISFPSNESESIFKLKSGFLSIIPTTYGIVNTDYENYAALWGCDTYLLGSIQNVNIITRERVANEDYIKNAKESLEKFDVDLSLLRTVDQSHCSSSEANSTQASEYSNMVFG